MIVGKGGCRRIARWTFQSLLLSSALPAHVRACPSTGPRGLQAVREVPLRCRCRRRGYASERLTIDSFVHILALEIRHQLEQVVLCPSAMCRGNDLVGVETELLGLGGPCSFHGSDGIGQGAVLLISGVLL